ncbi:hypothetical protein [Paramagnetospirillum magneticum]|nr:hypothetical protein [Paramagnetospirillum magneticum]
MPELTENDILDIELRNRGNDDVAALLRRIEDMADEIAEGEKLLDAIRSCERDLDGITNDPDSYSAPLRALAETLLEAVI